MSAGKDAGQWDGAAIKDIYNITSMAFLCMNFIEYILICIAIYSQWQIEAEYNFRFELLMVGIVWFVCNTITNFSFIVDNSIFDAITGKSG